MGNKGEFIEENIGDCLLSELAGPRSNEKTGPTTWPVFSFFQRIKIRHF
jgi:hypothetical protein